MAIKEIRLPDSTVVVIDEWLQWPAFSTFEAAKDAALDVRIFSYVVGGRIPQSGTEAGGRRDANITDTNWVARSRVNHDEAYIWYSVTYEHFALENSEPYANAPAVHTRPNRQLWRTTYSLFPCPRFHPDETWYPTGVQ